MRVQIDGNPIPYSRPRVTRHGTYNPRYNEKKTITTQLLSHRFEKLTEPLKATLVFSLPIPKSTSKKNREAMLAHKIVPTKKPDIDNLVKFILDCANGVLFEDDKQIVELVASKRYSDAPSTILHIENIQKG